ncbi:MAG TPA: DNA polymerase III subunit beta, partial [Candidatus Tectomicrobia bacterium]
MKLTVQTAALNQALGVVARMTNTRASLPVLANVLLEAQNDSLRLSATNLETSVSVTVRAKVESHGALMVPGRTLADIAKILPDGPVSLDIATNNRLLVRANGQTSRLAGIPAEEFPPLPEADGDPILTLQVEELQAIARTVAFAASKDDARPVLTGVLFQQDVLAASDGFRLAETHLGNDSATKGSHIVPAGVFADLARIATGAVQVYITSRSQIVFIGDSLLYAAALIEGTFPDYHNIIPARSDTTVQIAVDDLIPVLKAALVFGREAADKVDVEIVPG